MFNFAALPPERRREFMTMIQSMLTPAEKRLCTEDVLNVDRLSEAVQANKIKAETVAEHATEKFSAPFIRVTVAGGGE